MLGQVGISRLRARLGGTVICCRPAERPRDTFGKVSSHSFAIWVTVTSGCGEDNRACLANETRALFQFRPVVDSS